MLRHDRFDEADPWLKKLEGLSPDDLGAAALRARWLRGKGQPEKIEPLVEPLAERLSKKLRQRHARKKRSWPSPWAISIPPSSSIRPPSGGIAGWSRCSRKRFEPLANCAGAARPDGKAIEICRNAAKSDHTARPAITLALALLAGKPSAEDFRLAEPVLAKAAADHKDDVDLLSAVASVRVVQQRLDEAVGHVPAGLGAETGQRRRAEQPCHLARGAARQEAGSASNTSIAPSRSSARSRDCWTPRG